jgi:hypothetical protein
MNGNRHVSLTTALILTTILAISALLTAAKEPAPSLEGYWKGSGIVSHKGANDRVECRVRYTRAGGGSFSYTATCAMESGKYDLTGSVTNTSSSRYSGTVVGGSEGSRETGRVSLIQRGKALSVSVTSRSGSARMTLFKLD